MRWDAIEDVFQVFKWVDPVSFASVKNAIHDGGAVSADLVAGEEPILASHGRRAQRALGGIIVNIKSANLRVAREGAPVLPCITDHFPKRAS